MIIDLILDRRDGHAYNPAEFYGHVVDYASIFKSKIMHEIARQMDEGTEQHVKHALCHYVLVEGYNPGICDYINSVCWLPDWWEMN